MGEGVNHIVKRGEVQIVQAVQSLRSVQVVENGKSGSICSNRFARGFFYFKLPDGIERLENLSIEVNRLKNRRAINFPISLPS